MVLEEAGRVRRGCWGGVPPLGGLGQKKTDEAKKLLSTVLRANSPTVRPFFAPPVTPDERVRILRKAYTDTMKDPEFLAEAKKGRLDIEPADGAELEQNVREIFKLEPALVAKLKEILK